MASPAFSAPTVFKLIMLVAWKCLCDTRPRFKHPLFARFFATQEELEAIAEGVSLCFAPGLFEVLKASNPPPFEYFRSLTPDPLLSWGIYAITMENPGKRPRLYIGSATSIGTPTYFGARLRLKNYDDGVRLMFLILEATFAYIFWAMKAKKGDYGMGHICFWDREKFEYDALCSHCALDEGIRGEFDMSPEEYEVYAKDRETKRRTIHREGNSNWHYEQMAENYTEYIEASHERLCDLSFTTGGMLEKHDKAAKHLRKFKEHLNPFIFKPCNVGFHNMSNLARHEKSDRHRRSVEKQKAMTNLAHEDVQNTPENPITLEKSDCVENTLETPNLAQTLSTDYDEADRLYFENINLETVLDVYQLESASGVIISMGGQTPNNIALPLQRLNVNILGTSPEMIDMAENRYKFSRLLDHIEVDQPAWKELTSIEEATEFCAKVGYPVLVRPSYVLSGAAMNTVYSLDDLASYLNQAVEVSREHPVVITKYIENAKEIEMDAVAKNGVMVGHFISEHVENAGVHSGDATLILPPQDLDPETVRRIEEATRKIGNALNVTGPFNIQFIAKDNDIKVIECNVRASRSFPFVSKVMGVDLIEMATMAMIGKPFTEYPPVTIPKNYVGVKVPQFSFSRLSGADPVLGVEMASTGEVACFGRDRYEAYLKALISTGFKLPKKNVLFSIGSFKEKVEMLPSIRKLHALGYNLFATAGTADYLKEHGLPVKYLEVLAGEEEDLKSEYSLTQHLANNLIDLYINLPSSNRFRRPANYMSKGYRTRRMAVDYQTPLVTNVKNAKMLIEAIARHYTMDVMSIDCQTSYRAVTLPGLINVAAFVPGLANPDSPDFQVVTKASIANGFSMVRIMPVGVDSFVTDSQALRTAQHNSSKGSYCDFNLSVAATSGNSDKVGLVTGEVGSLFIPFNHLSGNINKVATVTSHFASWPTNKPIITDAKATDLASILLLASLHNRNIHVMSVTSKEDMGLIALSKEKGLKVTCDVAIYSLFLSTDDYPGCTCLPSKKDQEVLWEHLDTIDIFSIGSLPYQVAGSDASPAVGIQDALPLLFTAVSDKRLTIEDVTSRLHDNPKRIFELHDQPDASVEIEFDRPYVFQSHDVWSPFSGKTLKASVRRVTFQGKTSCLDGEMMLDAPKGADMSSHRLAPPAPASPAVKDILPTSPRSESAFGRRLSFSATPLQRPSRFKPAAPDGYAPSVSGDEFVPAAPIYPYPSRISPSLQQLLSQSSFKQKHILSVSQFTRPDLHLLFTVAQEMRLGVQRHGVLDILKGRVLTTLFFEPSTRTSASFDAAMQRLGGRTIPVATEHSSTQKGETLQDTVRTLGCYSDAIVLRHPDDSSAATAAKFSPVPIINGGNGAMEHPTQAFLDLFTIREELGTVNDITITFTGDLKYGRTVHSLVKLLQFYEVRVQLVSPKALAIPEEVRQQLVSSGQLILESTELTPEIIARSDVLYCTRVQKERFEDLGEYERLKNAFVIDNAALKHAKSQMIVMHPLPRNQEVCEEVDFDQRAAYFRQMKYGLYCRMALLALVMAS
ncbi:hypothetical protein EMPG_16705 [Blastomyces silverae]|uniref:Uncharacterized protein n=1 Tax=Blastomyces silverae TaxID=2060906 RepID=A0A0H1B8S4_9EURO|nr:hypothetical protein EMPG_16705 [Blastomyces silverae]